jgi:hypothetical protein
MGEDNAHTGASIGQPERRETSGSPGQRWKGNIKMYLKEIGHGGVVCLNLLRDRDSSWVLLNMVTNFFLTFM